MKLWIIFIAFTILIFPAFSEEVIIDFEDYCAGLDVTYTVYTQEDFENRTEIHDDEDTNFTQIDANYVIYDGPFSSFDILSEGGLESNQFEVHMPDTKDYLIIIESDSYEGETRYLAEDCGIHDSSVDEEIEEVEFQDFYFEGDFGEMTILRADSNNESLFSISQDIETQDLENVEYSFEIGIDESVSYEKIDLVLEFEEDQPNSFTLYRLNDEWSVVEENILLSPTEIELTESGAYALVKEIEEEEVVEESSQQEVLPSAPTNDSSNATIYYIIGGIILIALISGPILFKTNKKEKDYSEQAMNSYKEEYERTKQYVQQYRRQYPQEAIKQALEKGNVPKDIVDKVFREEYYEK